MSILSGEGMSHLVACSAKAKKYVVIYYHYDDAENRMKNFFVCVPIDAMIPSPNTPFQAGIKTSTLELESDHLNYAMNSICTEGKNRGRLYFFGGLGPPLDPRVEQNEYVLKKVYRYDLHRLPKKVGQMIPCKEMIYEMRKPFLVQVGDDCIYVLNCGKTQFNDSFKPAFQEFNFKKDEWVLLDDGGILDCCECDEYTRKNLNLVPHVVIGHKLHISIGNSSFTFDFIKRAWENCKLFETFWAKNGISPLNFYGMWAWVGADAVEASKRKRVEVVNYGGGPPFGFSGKGIIWDKNILLGVHFAKNCPLVAFLLDDMEEGGRAVKSQAVTLKGLDLEHDMLHLDARLVDLGREDGYFGIINFVSVTEDVNEYSYGVWNWGDLVHMELVIFRVWRPQNAIGAPSPGDDDHFLECEFVGREIIVRSCDENYNAFSVCVSDLATDDSS